MRDHLVQSHGLGSGTGSLVAASHEGVLGKVDDPGASARADRIANRFSATIFLVALLQVTVPPLLNGFLGAGGFQLVANAVNTTQAAGASDALRLGLVALSLSALGWAALSRRRASSPLALAVITAPVVYVFLRSLYVSSDATGSFVAMSIALLAIWALRPSLHVAATVGHSIGMVAISSIAAGVFMPTVGIFVDQFGASIALDKWSPFPTLLRGVYSHPNTLGQVLTIGVWAVLAIPNVRVRILYFTASLIALLWTGSRTALIVAVLVAGLALGLKLAQSRALRQLLSITVTVLSALTVALVPLFTTDLTAFSYRGQIWAGSLRAWTTSPVFGVLAAIAVLSVSVRASGLARNGIFWPILVIVATVALSIQEVPLNFSSLTATGPVTWLLLGVIMFSRESFSRAWTAGAVNGDQSVV